VDVGKGSSRLVKCPPGHDLIGRPRENKRPFGKSSVGIISGKVRINWFWMGTGIAICNKMGFVLVF
jgi:hypothetical protein